MDAKQRIQAHRQALKDVGASGRTTVPISAVQSLLDALEGDLASAGAQLHPVELEKFKSDLAGSLAYQGHVHNWSIEGFKQVIALGQSALKSIMLINGGAAAALLAFLGSLIARPSLSSASIVAFAGSMRLFVGGVFFAALAYATTYFSQLFYDGDKKWQQRTGLALHFLTSLIGATSLGAFVWGANAAYDAFLAFAP